MENEIIDEVNREELIIKQANEEIAAEAEGREAKDYLSKPVKKEDEVITKVEEPPVKPEIEPKPEDEQTEEEKAKLAEEAAAKLETKTPEELAEEAQEVLEYSQRHSMTEAEATEDIAKTNTIIEQFKHDPKEMARALRSKDREYDKLKNETEKKLKETKPIFVALGEDDFRREAYKTMQKDLDKYLIPYKERYPAKSEFVSDEALLEEILDRDWLTYKQYAGEQEGIMRTQAEDKKKDVLATIPKEDSRFLPEIQEVLKHIPEADILKEGFDKNVLLYLVKGRNFDAEIKAAVERGYKRGKEGTSILGVKDTPKSQKPSGPAKIHGSDLNTAQKERAVQMFGNNKEEDDCYRLFKETFEDQLKENPKFL